MRTRYITIGLVACTLSASAQRLETRSGFGNKLRMLPTVAQPTPERTLPSLTQDREVIWSEDFANGLAGNNPSGAWSVSGANGNLWRISTTAPVGFYSPAALIIGSTTAANGFAKFASDSANCVWNGNTPTALPEAQFVDWEGSLVSPVIDLSANPNVEILFQQRSRYCCGDSPFFLEFSTDGGATWPDTLLTNPNIDANQTNPPTENRRFDISDFVVGDPSNFRFRFRHNSTQGTSHYFWQIDDISIATLPDNEIAMNYGYTSTTGNGEEYGRIPEAQLPAAMNMGAEIFNYGQLDQTNVEVFCSVTKNSTGEEVLNYSSFIGTIPPGETVITDDDVTLPELELGLYTATFTVNSDQLALDSDTTDNKRLRTFEVTTDRYSLDNIGNHPEGLEQISTTGSNSFANNTENVKLMTMYIITTPMTITGLEIDISARSDVGSFIIASILDTTSVLQTPPVVNQPVNGAESDPYFITAADLTAGVIGIPFPGPLTLQPGAYYAVASLFSDNDSAAVIVDDTTVPQPALASVLWIPFDPENNQNLYGGNGEAWGIRLTGNASISVPERGELEGITMFPNPTNGIVRVNGMADERYTMEVFNMLGEVMHTGRFTGNTVIDLANFSAGIYNVRLSNGTRSTVQRITLN